MDGLRQMMGAPAAPASPTSGVTVAHISTVAVGAILGIGVGGVVSTEIARRSPGGVFRNGIWLTLGSGLVGAILIGAAAAVVTR